MLNFALRAGAAMLSSGAATIEVEATILDLTTACGLDRCEADVTFTSMTASYVRGDDLEPITAVQVVRHRSVDYGRLAGVSALRADLMAGRVTVEEAIARLDKILTAHPRDGRAVLASWAGMATAFTVLLGGRWLAAVIAFVSATVVTLLMRMAARQRIPDFFLTALGSAVATAFAMGVVVLGLPVRTPVVVAGGIMVLVPGYALVASVQDAITGFPISGSARGLEVLLTATGIITGVATTLYAAVSMGVTLRIGAVVTTSFAQVPVQVAAAGVAAYLYAMATLVPRRSLVYAGLVGAGGWALHLLLGHAGVSALPATTFAAISIGAAGAALAKRQESHSFVYVVPGLMPLVPGLTIYQGMLDLFTGSGAAAGTLLRSVALGLAIAAGAILGEMIIRPIRLRTARAETGPGEDSGLPVASAGGAGDWPARGQ